jgi:hypothetical protein
MRRETAPRQRGTEPVQPRSRAENCCHVIAQAGLRHVIAQAGLRHVIAEAGLRHVIAEAGLRHVIAEAGLRHEIAEAGLRDTKCRYPARVGTLSMKRLPGMWVRLEE